MPRASWLLVLIAGLLLPQSGRAQATTRRVKIDLEGSQSVQVGFATASKSGDSGFKAGLWTPITVRFSEGEPGDIELPVAVDGTTSGELLVEVPDYDGVFNTYPEKFTIGPNQPLQVVTYTKAASTYLNLKVSVRTGGRTVRAYEGHFTGIEVDHHLYLALNDTLPDLNEALVRKVNPNAAADPNASRETRPRYLCSENKVANLPAQWFGYSPVDLAILATATDSFLSNLIGADRKATPQLQALAEWVRRGGRLVVSIAPTHREKVLQVLSSAAWQPALPPVFTIESKPYKLTALDRGLVSWTGLDAGPFKGKDGRPPSISAVKLHRHPSATVLSEDRDGDETVPVIVRLPHGLGSITLLGFDVKDQVIFDWPGKYGFWQKVVKDFAPTVAEMGAIAEGKPFQKRGGGIDYGGTDLTSRLYQQLEQFDTPTISFGWVVLFIFLYIVIIGPVDYVLLKLFFKRLELTWITFPAVVVTVSLLAYFTAYAIKGQDLKINKVDLVDIDMRSGVKEDGSPGSARAFGTCWFTILSPRIQNYTVGLEPMLYRWQGLPAPAQPIEPTMSWLARPETGGLGSSGRGRSASLFTRSYSYEPNAIGLRDVPIPVWTTKSFTASWSAPFSKMPFDVKLNHEAGRPSALGGTLTNNLPFDLKECALIYHQSVYLLPDLRTGETLQIVPDQLHHKTPSDWANLDFVSSGSFDPSLVLRQLMFYEKTDPGQRRGRNHAHRNLDFSWRLKDDTDKDERGDQTSLREAILVCRLDRGSGPSEALHAGNDPRLATHLWLGEIPGTAPGLTRPALQGNMLQETFVRVLMPVIPKKE
jgi:hypothetical protein